MRTHSHRQTRSTARAEVAGMYSLAPIRFKSGAADGLADIPITLPSRWDSDSKTNSLGWSISTRPAVVNGRGRLRFERADREDFQVVSTPVVSAVGIIRHDKLSCRRTNPPNRH